MGDGVSHLAVGDKIVMGTPPACGSCPMCLADHHCRCQRLTDLAFGTHPHTPEHGAYARMITAPAEAMIVVPDELTDEQSAMVEPAAVALHAVNRAAPRLGDVVVVLGAGPVGLMVVQMLRVAGVSTIIVVEPRERRRDIASTVGADTVVTPYTDVNEIVRSQTAGRGADLVFDCVGNQATLRAAVELARPDSVIMLVGVASGDLSVTPLVWLSKELTIKTSLAHNNWEFHTLVDLMLTARVRTDPLLDDIVGLSELGTTLQSLAAGDDRVKILVDPRR